jgi:3-hydroxybutyryl-CoA dehydrogenase
MSKLTKIGVIGAGQMGAGIAQVCAAAGYVTSLWDQESSYLDRGMSFIQQNLQKSVDKGKLTGEQLIQTKERLIRAKSLEAVASADLIIEAIVEKFDPKAALFKKLDDVAPPHTILASNTSSISITKLAAVTRRADRFIGIHFMNPVPVMKLVEIIKGLQTSAETYEQALLLVKSIDKTSVLGIDTPGFIVNRILVPMINEAIYLLQEGVTPQDIDTAMKLGTNQPMGPLELADFVGLDTLLYILQVLHKELGEDKYRPCPLLIRYVDAGWYGKKVGRGFYTYS